MIFICAEIFQIQKRQKHAKMWQRLGWFSLLLSEIIGRNLLTFLRKKQTKRQTGNLLYNELTEQSRAELSDASHSTESERKRMRRAHIEFNMAYTRVYVIRMHVGWMLAKFTHQIHHHRFISMT